MEFTESRLRFEFQEEEWDALIKYDNEADYQKIKRSIPGTKAVDFVGISNENLYFIEVKNYRGHRIESKPKVEELDTIIAQKVRDTLAGIMGGVRNSTHKEKKWQKHLSHLSDKNKPVHIILWMEEEPPNRFISKRQKVSRDTLTQKLKKRTSWLSGRVIVANKAHNPLEGKLQVSFPDDG